MEELMQCPTCKKETLRPWKGQITRMGVELAVAGQRCSSCEETIFDGDEVQRQERDVATAIVARGVRTADEFKFVRKVAGFRANELAELLDVRAETISRWERAEAEIPRSAAFALGELYDRPRVTREKLEAFARSAG
jgi:putative zinc finger/helix-turn-helix YgiT family protein